MRFEFSKDNVNSLVMMVYDILDDVEKSSLSFLIISHVEMIIKKIKMYGLNGFANREQFRNEIAKMNDMVALKKKLDTK